MSATSNEVTTQWVEMTPERASKLLQEHNPDNRKLRPRKVEIYAEDMKNGRWRETGQPILISKSGRLVDGQHRLSACVRSGKSFKTLLVEGVDDTVIIHVDRGLPRTHGDMLKFRGNEKWTEDVARVAKLLVALNRGIHLANRQAVTVLGDELIIHVSEKWYDEIIECLRRGSVLDNRLGISRRLWAAFIFEIRRIDEEMANEFYDRLNSGAGLEHGSAILALRNWAITQARRNQDKKAALSDQMYFVAFHKAWNAWLRGENVNAIKHYDRNIQPLENLDWKEVRLEQKR